MTQLFTTPRDDCLMEFMGSAKIIEFSLNWKPWPDINPNIIPHLLSEAILHEELHAEIHYEDPVHFGDHWAIDKVFEHLNLNIQHYEELYEYLEDKADSRIEYWKLMAQNINKAFSGVA